MWRMRETAMHESGKFYALLLAMVIRWYRGDIGLMKSPYC
jgi:hypothetical protein